MLNGQQPQDRGPREPQKELHIIHWNVNSARSSQKRSYVIAMLKNENPDVALLQETNLTEDQELKIPGYRIFHKRGPRGLATAVKKSIPANTCNDHIPAGQEVETLAVTIHLEDGPLLICNVYKNCNRHRGASLTPQPLLEHLQCRRSIVAGDFNAHHPLWEPPGRLGSCLTGDALARALDETHMVLLNTGAATHVNGGALDLALATPDIAMGAEWSTSDDILSDHFAAHIRVSLQKITPPPKAPRRQYHKADWEAFRIHLHQWIDNFQDPEDLESLEAALTKALDEAAEVAIPMSKPGTPRKEEWFYTDRVREMKRRVNQRGKFWKRNHSQENKQALTEVKSHAKLVIQEERTKKWLEWCDSLSYHTPVKKMWEKLKTITGKRVSPPAHQNPQQHAEEIMIDFAARASTAQLPEDTRRTLQELQDHRRQHLAQAIATPDPDLDREFTLKEFRQATKNSRTAPGADGVTHQMIFEAGIFTHNIFLDLINRSFMEKQLPSVWKKADLLPIPKPKQPGKYRPIALTSCPCKLMEKMILNRIRWKLGSGHPNIFGFRPGVGTTDAIASLLTEVDTTEHDSPRYVVFIDLEKAFELANADAILHQLASKGITGKTLAWIEDFLTDRLARVRFLDNYSDYYHMENGTPQGSVLSPALFNTLMEALVTQHLPPGVLLLSYADDLALVASGPDALRNVQTALNILTQDIQTLGLKISVEKTKAMTFLAADPPAPLLLTDRPLEWTSTFQYLGVILDKWLTFKDHVEYATTRIRKRLNFMNVMTSPAAGATSTVLGSFYSTCIRPVLEYAACALILTETRHLDKLDKLQNIAMRRILGAPGWTKVATLQEETNLPPLTYRIQQLVTGLAVKVLTSPDESLLKGPLQEAIEDEMNANTARWPSIVARLLKTLSPSSVNQLREDQPCTPDCPPWTEPPGTFISVLPETNKKTTDRDTLRTQALARIRDIDLNKEAIFYTDGSVDPTTNRAGAGIVTITPGLAPEHSVTETAVRVADGASTMQTELVAICAALSIAEEMEANSVAIHTDSLSSIQALRNNTHTDNRDLITTAQHKIKAITEEGGSVTVHWVPSHVGIPYNEKADQVASAATALPRVTFNPNRSRSQLKADYARGSKLAWKRTVSARSQASPSITWRRAATGDTVVKMPLAIRRKNEVAILRLRLGYRCRDQIKAPTEVECTECSLVTNQPLVHYVLECPVTSRFFGEAADVEDTNSALAAAQRVRRACDNLTELAKHVGRHPPPR